MHDLHEALREWSQSHSIFIARLCIPGSIDATTAQATPSSATSGSYHASPRDVQVMLDRLAMVTSSLNITSGDSSQNLRADHPQPGGSESPGTTVLVDSGVQSSLKDAHSTGPVPEDDRNQDALRPKSLCQTVESVLEYVQQWQRYHPSEDVPWVKLFAPFAHRSTPHKAFIRTNFKFAKPWKDLSRPVHAADGCSTPCADYTASDLWGYSTLVMLVPAVDGPALDAYIRRPSKRELDNEAYEKRYRDATVTHVKFAGGRSEYSPTRSEVSDSECESSESGEPTEEVGELLTGCATSLAAHNDNGSDCADAIAQPDITYSASAFAAQSHLSYATLDPVPLIPLVVVADEDDIISLMCSSLHQRRTLGVLTPVLGVAYTPTRHVCRILFGWLSADRAPATAIESSWATIALPSKSATSPCEGVFDLRSPAQARSFILFLQQACNHLLESHTSTKLAGTGVCDSDSADMPMIWRADTVYAAHCTLQPEEQGNMRLHMWLKEINELDLNPDFDWAQHLATEVAYRDPLTRSRLTWPSVPYAWLLEAKLTKDIEFKYPGICEWSLDHHVLTLAFFPNGETHKRYDPYIGKLFLMLHPLGDLSSEDCLCLSQHSSCDFTNCDPSLAARHALENNSVQGLAAVISGSVVIQRSQTPPAIAQAWEDIAEWFWVTRGSCQQRMGNTVYSAVWTIRYSRCAEYDIIVQNQADGSPKSELAALGGEISAGEGSAEAAVTTSYFPYDSIYDVAERNMELGHTDEWALRKKMRYRTKRERECVNEVGQIDPSSDNALQAIYELREDAKYKPPTSLRNVRRRMTLQMKARLLKYPLSGEHGAITVPLQGFFEELRATLGDAVVRELKETLPMVACNYSAVSMLGSTAHGRRVEGSMDQPLHLPVLIVTSQRFGEALDNPTRNRQRIACTSAVRFLLALGVADFPVYGLSICGPYGILCMAWYSSQDKCCYIVDRNTAHHRFDLTEEQGILRYVAFLAEIEEHGRELLRRVELAKPDLIKRAQTEAGRASVRWTLHSQLDDYSLWPEKKWEEEYS
ncbi:hypothetical protein OH77DRAFT_1432014 [Trametes cingulata]|nr:hypothetical protein OH77DRAFT_1432014 [Trametes cingulata]